MGRQTSLEIQERNGDISYFRSVDALITATGWKKRDIMDAIETGRPIKGTNKVAIRLVPFQRVLYDRNFYSICWSIPWNYKVGIDVLAEREGLTMAAFLRKCVISSVSEEEIWKAAETSEVFQPGIFRPIPVGKERRPTLRRPKPTPIKRRKPLFNSFDGYKHKRDLNDD